MRTTAKLRDLRGAALAPLLRDRPDAAKPAAAPALAAPAALHPHTRFRLLWLLDSLPMRALRRFIASLLARALEFALYIAIAAATGLASAWYMVDVGSSLTVDRDGPWQSWTLAGSPDADPYTRAHFARAGWLPLSATAAIYFSTTRDSAGEALYADCDYVLQGAQPVARRWTLAAFDLAGQPLPQTGGPRVVASDSVLPGPGGTVTIRLSPSTSAGNWLGTAGAVRMQLLLTLYGVQQTAAVQPAAEANVHLFKIDKAECR